VPENPAQAAQEAFLRRFPGQRDAVAQAYDQKPSDPDEGRLMRCTKCGDEVLVHELPGWFLESERFVCGECMFDKDSGAVQPTVMPAADAVAPEQLPDPGRQAIGKFNAGGPDTQRKAAIAQWPTSGTQRRHILDFIAEQEDRGATDEEIEQCFGARHQSASARRNELMNDGWIEDSGKRRRTTSGKEAIVWVLSDAGRAQN